jgi:hypothetical protein
MGTPAAPLYSIITFGHHENTNILLPRFKDNLLFYKRYIDYRLGTWVDTPENSWTQFTSALNDFGNLRWNIETPSMSSTFLDLTITINEGKIDTTTYQKPLNLYLYILPLYAHPHSCIKGLITGEILQYWNQNSTPKDFYRYCNSIHSTLH